MLIKQKNNHNLQTKWQTGWWWRGWRMEGRTGTISIPPGLPPLLFITSSYSFIPSSDILNCVCVCVSNLENMVLLCVLFNWQNWKTSILWWNSSGGQEKLTKARRTGKRHVFERKEEEEENWKLYYYYQWTGDMDNSGQNGGDKEKKERKLFMRRKKT